MEEMVAFVAEEARLASRASCRSNSRPSLLVQEAVCARRDAWLEMASRIAFMSLRSASMTSGANMKRLDRQ
eukprot:3353922-Pleurochrysis_carterae.AAC.1